MVVRRRLAVSGPGMVFVTTTVVDWVPVFSSDKCARALVEQLAETVSFYNLSVAVYAVMPSHLHLLARLPNVEKLSRIMQSFKSLSARRIEPLLDPRTRLQLHSGGQFHLWKQRFDDVMIASEEQFRIKADYIHRNPVKAGLVQDVVDFEFSSALAWETGEQGVVQVDFEWSWEG